MIRVQNIYALFLNQVKNTLKNLPVTVLYLVYPCIALVMTQAMKDQPGTEMFLSIFAGMHCIFTPIVSTAMILAEEKEKNTLRILIMSNVSLKEYFLSIGSFVLIADLITGSLFLIQTDYTALQMLQFLLVLGAGCLISIVLGICLGLYAKNASAANGMAVPLGMVFAFMPMLASFNKSIETVSRFTYGQQISYLLSGKSIHLIGFIIVFINVILFIILSTILYKKSISAE